MSSTYTPKMKQYLADRYKRKLKIAKAYLGGCCVRCGTSRKLEFDHIKPKTKVANVTSLLCGRWEILKVELDKCQLLCRKCHVKKTTKQLRKVGFFNHDKAVKNGRKGGRAFARNLKSKRQ